MTPKYDWNAVRGRLRFKVAIEGLEGSLFDAYRAKLVESFGVIHHRVWADRAQFVPVFPNFADKNIVTLGVGDTLTFEFPFALHGEVEATKNVKAIFMLHAILPSYEREQESPSHIDAATPSQHEAILMNILKEADKTVNSDRQGEYGDPVENAVRAALVATATQGKAITPEDIIQVMHSQKMVRSGRGHKTDTNVDQAGYAEIRERVQKAVKDGTVQRIVEKLLGGWVKFNPEPPVLTNATLKKVEYTYAAQMYVLEIAVGVEEVRSHAGLQPGKRIAVKL